MRSAFAAREVSFLLLQPMQNSPHRFLLLLCRDRREEQEHTVMVLVTNERLTLFGNRRAHELTHHTAKIGGH